MACLTDEWLPMPAAREVSGWTAKRIKRAVAEGKIRSMQAGGRVGSRHYSRADLLRAAGILR